MLDSGQCNQLCTNIFVPHDRDLCTGVSSDFQHNIVRHLSAEEKAGDWAEVENTLKMHGNFVACIESFSVDLTGGFVGTAKYRGYYKITSEDYYSGELYADEEVGIT